MVSRGLSRFNRQTARGRVESPRVVDDRSNHGNQLAAEGMEGEGGRQDGGHRGNGSESSVEYWRLQKEAFDAVRRNDIRIANDQGSGYSSSRPGRPVSPRVGARRNRSYRSILRCRRATTRRMSK